MSKKKGSLLDSINVIFALIIFMSTMVFMVLMVMGHITSFGGGVETSITKIRAVEAAHLVQKCLTMTEGEDSNYIKSDILDRYNGDGVDKFCKIEKPSIDAQITDIETKVVWKFNSAIDEGDADHTIWVPILYGDRTVRMGRLDVEI
jgi:hypothetical protein